MRSPLHSRIADASGRVRRLLALHGLSLVVAGAGRLRPAGLPGRLGGPPGARASAWPCWWASSAWPPTWPCGTWSRPLVVRFRDLDIALKIERRWPGLNDRLASTVQFLDLDAPVRATATTCSARAPCATPPSSRRSTRPRRSTSARSSTPARPAALVDRRGGRRCWACRSSRLDARLGTLALRRLFTPVRPRPLAADDPPGDPQGPGEGRQRRAVRRWRSAWPGRARPGLGPGHLPLRRRRERHRVPPARRPRHASTAGTSRSRSRSPSPWPPGDDATSPRSVDGRPAAGRLTDVLTSA